MTAAIVLLIAWGALAFGAVYPWAYTPLLIGSALTGAAALVRHRDRRFPGPTRAALFGLVVVMAAAALQLVPLPSAVLGTVSPNTDAFLEKHDLGYAFGGMADADPAESEPVPAKGAWHPLSLAPRRTSLALGFLSALTVLLAGVTLALS